MAVPAIAPTLTWSMEIAGRAIPALIPVTVPSCSRVCSTAGSGIPPLFGFEMLSWNGSPYSAGVAVRCERLAPNTAVPHRRSPPRRCRGGHCRPARWPRHSFARARCGHRSPRSAVLRSTRESRPSWRPTRGRPARRAVPGAPPSPTARCQVRSTTTTVTSTPTVSTSQSNEIPVEPIGNTRFAERRNWGEERPRSPPPRMLQPAPRRGCVRCPAAPAVDARPRGPPSSGSRCSR